MRQTRQVTGWDSTLALAREGYAFVSRRCQRYGSDVFTTRLLLQPTICLRGRDAAELFYDNRRFHRHTATPRRVQTTLLGIGGVQGLDEEAHRRRKQLFLSMMTPPAVASLADPVAVHRRARFGQWQAAGSVVLYDEVAPILCRAVHQWAAVPLHVDQVTARTHDLHAMIEATAAVGPRHRRGLAARPGPSGAWPTSSGGSETGTWNRRRAARCGASWSSRTRAASFSSRGSRRSSC